MIKTGEMVLGKTRCECGKPAVRIHKRGSGAVPVCGECGKKDKVKHASITPV